MFDLYQNAKVAKSYHIFHYFRKKNWNNELDNQRIFWALHLSKIKAPKALKWHIASEMFENLNFLKIVWLNNKVISFGS